jgi:hypothetical protein
MKQVARDYRGLRTAALEFFAEALLDQRAERTLARAAEYTASGTDMDGLIDSFAPRRSLADGYYTRVDYLLSLRRLFDAGVTFKLDELRVTEVEGMRVVEDARQEFLRTHPACGKCGAVCEPADLRCYRCQSSLSSQEAAA